MSMRERSGMEHGRSPRAEIHGYIAQITKELDATPASQTKSDMQTVLRAIHGRIEAYEAGITPAASTPKLTDSLAYMTLQEIMKDRPDLLAYLDTVLS